MRPGPATAAAVFSCLAFTTPFPGMATETTLPGILKGHGGPVMAVAISEDAHSALTASFDYTVIHHDLSGPENTTLTRLVGHAATVNEVAFRPGGTEAVSVGDDGTTIIWNLTSGTEATRFAPGPEKATDLALGPEGRIAAVARWDETVRLYDLDAGSETARLGGHRGNVNAVAFSSDGEHLFSGGYDGRILIHDPNTPGASRPLHSHGWGINALAVLDSGAIVFGALDGTVAVIDPLTGDLLHTLTESETPVLTLAVSPDGLLVAFGSSGGQIGVFDARTMKPVESATVAHGPVFDLAFVPGTAQIYHSGLDDFAIRWQIAPLSMEPVRSESPRRFQISDTDDPGELEFLRKCSVCHTLTPDDANRAGPTLHNLFGRKAGTLPGYSYSEALQNADLIWGEKTLARLFDEGPDVVVPGTKMPMQQLKSVERLSELIRFLKTATAPLE